MLEFAHPQYLYWLIGLLGLLGLSIVSYQLRRRWLHRLASRREMRDLLMPQRIGRKRLTRDILFLCALALVIVALARPQEPSKESRHEDQRGIEVMICIDVSNSMLSTDIPPSRMSFTKRTIARLIDQLSSDRVGIIIFAANAYVQLPITSDHSTAQEFLSDVSPQMLSAQGTNIGEAIRLAQSAFSDRKDIGKTILVFTDAEDQEEGSAEAAAEAAEAGIKVNVIGIGTPEGGPIPMPEGYLKDDDGEVVTTRLNAEVGRDVASKGNGSFITSSKEGEVLELIHSELDHLPKAALGHVDRAGYVEHYLPWIAAAIVLLLIESFISQRRNRLWRRYNIFGHDK